MADESTNVLTTASTITCKDSGTVTTDSTAKLTVKGKPVLLKGEISKWSIAGCTQTNANASETQCSSMLSADGGDSARLKSMGETVLLEGLNGTTNGAPKNGLSAKAGHTLLKAE